MRRGAALDDREDAAGKVVYVSCDPATLARDVKYLRENGYEVRKAKAVDQFPHTVHVESVVLFVTKGFSFVNNIYYRREREN